MARKSKFGDLFLCVVLRFNEAAPEMARKCSFDTTHQPRQTGFNEAAPEMARKYQEERLFDWLPTVALQ